MATNDQETIAELKKALFIASEALSIAADWNIYDVQVNPPKEWNLESDNESSEDGWCSTRELSQKFLALSK